MRDTIAAALADRLAGAGTGDAHPDSEAPADATVDRAVEVGIGRNAAVAARLAARGVDVTATDVYRYETPQTIRFVRDDVTDPDPAVYRGADVVYALNCPPELHRALRDVARVADADCYFTTLGGDPPAVDVTPEQVPGETLYRVE